MRARDTVTRVLAPCNAFIHATALDNAASAALDGQALLRYAEKRHQCFIKLETEASNEAKITKIDVQQGISRTSG